MNPTEASIALGIAARVDNRQPSDVAARAWAETLHDITLEEAAWAIGEHRKHSTDYLQPAHVRALVKQGRHDAADRDASAETLRAIRAPRPDPEEAHRGAALVRDAFNAAIRPDNPELTALRRKAQRVPCPWCKAGIGRPCVVPNLDTPLTKTAAHPSRIDAMEAAA